MSPWLKGLIRAVILAVIGASISYLEVVPLPGEYAIYTMLLIAILREGEGIYDQITNPDQNIPAALRYSRRGR